MAKIGTGDERWIVKERSDGANCNNWHWTTKDVTGHAKQVLGDKLRELVFPAGGPLEHCRIKSAEVKGECSVNNRKGRTFLIYELEIKLKWEGELKDEAGVSTASTKGSLKFPDVTSTDIDDLECEFESKAPGTPLSEAMRKAGAAFVKAKVKEIVLELQEEVRAGAAEAKPVAAGPAPLKAPMPQPLKVEPAAAPAMAAAAASAAAYAVKGAAAARAAEAADSDDDDAKKGGSGDDEEAPPPPLAAALKQLRAGTAPKRLRLSNCGIRDVHLQPLIDQLHNSQCGVEHLDLAFNRLSDAGVHVLLKAVAGGAALELQSVSLGGNRVSAGGMALSQWLKQMRGDVLVEWKDQLKDAKSMCTVGTVYLNSPAQTTGLRSGDSVVAFGPCQFADFKSVTESIVPIVKASVGKPIDVVVVRMGEDHSVHQVALTLTPKSWSGAGLLGCILK